MSTKERLLFRKSAHPQTSDQAQGWEENIWGVADTLNLYDNSEARTPTLILENHAQDCRVKIKEDGIVQTLPTRMGTGGGNVPMVMEEHDMSRYVVRRLTILECTRLQGFPDGWVDIGEWTDENGKLHKDADSPKLSALGNSIALPFWDWLAGRITAQLKEDGVEDPTMASLFDGIGGFPLAFQKHGVKPVWASEIEPFCIAVTKKHFPEEEDGR